MIETQPHRFTIGTLECRIVQDGTFAYPHPAHVFFVGAHEDERDRALRDRGIDPTRWEEYVSPYPCLVVETDGETVLVDTGAGDLAPTTGNVRSNLRETGIAPADVDTVVLTHGHPDHVGGCVDEEDDPAFPEARYVMTDREWEFWTSAPDLSSLPVDDEIRSLLREVPETTLPLVRDRLELVDADTETEVAPGVSTVPAPGHTPGHVAVTVDSDGDSLLHLVDTVLHPIHLAHPEWHAATDYEPKRVVETRTRLLTAAATDRTPVLASHFPAPGPGYVGETDGAWDWEPLEERD